MQRHVKKSKPLSEKIIKIRSKINQDEYYSSKSFPEKVIDGEVFIGVKKNISDKNIFYMRKENMEVVKG